MRVAGNDYFSPDSTEELQSCIAGDMFMYVGPLFDTFTISTLDKVGKIGIVLPYVPLLISDQDSIQGKDLAVVMTLSGICTIGVSLSDMSAENALETFKSIWKSDFRNGMGRLSVTSPREKSDLVVYGINTYFTF